MDDLIRRGDVVDNIRKRSYYFGKAALDEAFDAVYKAPAVDAVAVVRCKECKEYETDCGFCDYWETGRNFDDFCSRGVRKEDA